MTKTCLGPFEPTLREQNSKLGVTINYTSRPIANNAINIKKLDRNGFGGHSEYPSKSVILSPAAIFEAPLRGQNSITRLKFPKIKNLLRITEAQFFIFKRKLLQTLVNMNTKCHFWTHISLTFCYQFMWLLLVFCIYTRFLLLNHQVTHILVFISFIIKIFWSIF